MLPGSAAEAAAARKRSKYATITLTHIFVPVEVETLVPVNAVPVNAKGLHFLDQIGDRLIAVTEDLCEMSFLYQRLSVLIQRFNMIISETDTEA